MLRLIVAEYAFRLTIVVGRMTGRHGAERDSALPSEITIKTN
jgi:hypothetical protein